MQLKCIVCSTIPQLTGQLPYLPITFSRRSFFKIFGILCYLHKCAARKNVKLAYKRSVAFLQKLSLWFTMLPYVHEFVCVFWVAWFVFMFMCVLFYLGQLSHFLSCFGAGVTILNEPPSSFLLPSHYCGLRAGSIRFRAIANNKQCEMRGYLCRWSSTTE